MIVQKDFLNKLKDFGINSYESKLWTALLSRGVSTAGELSDIAGVPRSRSYDVLESLERKGFIIMKLGKPIKYIAVPPTEVVERVRRKIVEDSGRQTKILEELRDSEILNELVVLHSKGIDLVEPTDLIGFLKGRVNIYHHLEGMIKAATTSLVMITTEEGLIRKMELLFPVFQKAKQRGVKIKIITNKSKKNQKAWSQFKSIGEIKHASVKARFIVTDSKEASFFLLGDDVHANYDVGISATTEFFAKSMEGMFNAVWHNLK